MSDREVSEAAFLAAARDGQVQIIEGAWHLLNLERPDEFTEAVRIFAGRQVRT